MNIRGISKNYPAGTFDQTALDETLNAFSIMITGSETSIFGTPPANSLCDVLKLSSQCRRWASRKT